MALRGSAPLRIIKKNKAKESRRSAAGKSAT